jgi:hypothetical protein
MIIPNYLRFTLSAFCLLLLLSGMARAELPIATGEHWTTATEREKKAFLLGMGTIIEVEHQLHGATPPSDDQSFVPLLVKGLSKFTLTSAMEAVDAWYAANPDQLKRPVIEVIWFELTLPNAS